MPEYWDFKREDTIPIVATSIHCGHSVPSWMNDLLFISDADRLHEEDPFTDIFTEICDNTLIVDLSRFAVDLNRPLETSVYVSPEHAWGLQVWKDYPGKSIISKLNNMYNDFYKELKLYLAAVKKQHGRFVLLDIHSYNYKRDGDDEFSYNKKLNPDVNIGTGTMKTDIWRPIIDGFIRDLGSSVINDRELDVRENIKFKGGHFPLWIHNTFPDSACVLSVEFKKIFMDELKGELFPVITNQLKEALRDTIPGLLRGLEDLDISK